MPAVGMSALTGVRVGGAARLGQSTSARRASGRAAARTPRASSATLGARPGGAV